MGPVTAVGWGVTAGAALTGVGLAGRAELLQATVIAVALWCGWVALRAVAAAARVAWAGCRRRSPPVLPSWPPGVDAVWPPRLAFPPRAAAGRSAVATWAAALGLGMLAGLAAGSAARDRQAAALAGLDLPRLTWVGGYAAAPWAFERWSARLWLVRPRWLPERCPTPGEGQPVAGGVEVSAPPGVARQLAFAPGRWVCVRGVLRQPEPASTPGAFSPRTYLQARGVLTRLELQSAQRWLVPENGVGAAPLGVRVRAWASGVAQSVAVRVQASAGARTAAWFRAVALGEPEALDAHTREALRASGLAHLTSVSGMHVGLLVGPLVLLARRLRRPAARWVAAGVAGTAGWLYAGATGMESPAVRALLMQSWALVMVAAGVRGGLMGAAMGWAAALQLSHNPQLAADLGFQLSYGATAGIALAATLAEGLPLVGGLSGAGALRPAPPAAAGRRLARLAVLWGYRGLRALAISAGAWAACAPLIGHHFGWVSPWGVLTSTLAGPAALALVWCGIGTWLLPRPAEGACGWLARAAAEILHDVAWAGGHLAERWPLLVPRAVWPWLAAVLLVGVAVRHAAGDARRVLAVAGVAALLVAMPPAPLDGVRLAGRPLQGGGWVWVGAQPGRPGWVVMRPPGRAAPGVARAVGSALAVVGADRVALAVLIHPGQGWAPAVRELGPPAAGAAVLLMAENGRLIMGTERGEAGGPVTRVSLGELHLRPWTADGGAGTGIELSLAGLEPLRVDWRGCAMFPGGSPACAFRQATVLVGGAGRWEPLR